MKINKDKHIGRVLFIVEGSKTEFAILYRIFCKLFGYSYIEKRRNCPTYFVSNNDRSSLCCVSMTIFLFSDKKLEQISVDHIIASPMGVGKSPLTQNLGIPTISSVLNESENTRFFCL